MSTRGMRILHILIQPAAKKNERTLLGLEEERKQFDQLRTELEKLHSSEVRGFSRSLPGSFLNTDRVDRLR